MFQISNHFLRKNLFTQIHMPNKNKIKQKTQNTFQTYKIVTNNELKQT